MSLTFILHISILLSFGITAFMLVVREMLDSQGNLLSILCFIALLVGLILGLIPSIQHLIKQVLL